MCGVEIIDRIYPVILPVSNAHPEDRIRQHAILLQTLNEQFAHEARRKSRFQLHFHENGKQPRSSGS